MNAYIFVAAAVFAVIPLLVILKVNINKLINDPEQIVKIQQHFFIGVALSKIVPVILLIFGIIKLTNGVDIRELYIPWLIILIVLGYALFFITSQKKLDVEDKTKIAINTLVTIARPLIFSIPLMAAFFLFMMTR